VRASAARSNLCRKLGLSPEQAVEYARRIYVIPAGFDPANNPQQARDFAEAWVVLCTVTKACRACNAGHFAERHFKALWMDEAHIGNDASEANRASNDATAAWWRLQTALRSSLVFALTGTIARWMQPVIEGGGLLVRHTYGDQYRERKAAKRVVSTLCTSGLVLDGRTIGEEPLTDNDRVLLHTVRLAAPALSALPSPPRPAPPPPTRPSRTSAPSGRQPRSSCSPCSASASRRA